MRWLLRLAAGPLIWAAGFSAIYALHGIGCAEGWPLVATPLGPLHRVVLLGGWIATLAAVTLVVVRRPRPALDRGDRLLGLGAWIGLVSVVVTLAPVVMAESCPAPYP